MGIISASPLSMRRAIHTALRCLPSSSSGSTLPPSPGSVQPIGLANRRSEANVTTMKATSILAQQMIVRQASNSSSPSSSGSTQSSTQNNFVSTPQAPRQRLPVIGNATQRGRSLEKRFNRGRNYAPSSLNLEKMYAERPRRAAPLLGPSRAVAEQNDPLFKLGLRPGHVSLHDDSYKNPLLLSTYVTEMGKIKPRRETGLTRRSQREVAKGIRRARSMGLMPVMSRNVTAWK